MSRLESTTTVRLAAAVIMAATTTAASAQNYPAQSYPAQPPRPEQPAVQQTGYALGTTMGLPAVQQGSQLPSVPVPGYGPVIPNQRPQSVAPLYPSPVQYTPPQNGGTIITNQALAPHEMLYPHRYRAMYGPYFYEVKGHTVWTPLGPRTFENWKLRGTEVDVKYHDHIRLFSGFHPPR